jgi:hypothetical protein
LDNLEIATGSDEETEQSPPPIPPRTSSVIHSNIPEQPLPIPPIGSSGSLNEISDGSTSSDASEILEDPSTNSDSDDSENEENDKVHLKVFNPDSNLPPIPNGTLDLTSPDKQKFSSDEER